MAKQFIQDKSCDLPITGEFDLIVIGGGTGGVLSAIAAARKGLKTLLIEQFGFLGGSQTGALVTPLMNISPTHSSSIGGINEEIRQRMISTGDAGEQPGIADGWFNPEILKYILEDFCLEAGVQLLYYTFFSESIVENNRLKNIIVQNKSGRQIYSAKKFIDASGDADVAISAGVDYESGRKEDGLNQAMSVRFNLGGINFDKFCKFLDKIEPGVEHRWPFVETAYTPDKDWPLTSYFQKGLAEGIIHEDDVLYFQNFSMPGRPGEMSFNCPRIIDRVKGYLAEDLTNAQIVGKQKIRRLTLFCKKYFPGFENAYIALTAPMVGVRESRRIIGEYQLSGRDIATAAKFPDAIARGNYPMDVHQPKKSKHSIDYSNIQPGDYYEIPYRCLVPKNIDELLVVGRCISARFEGQSAIRVQGIIRTMAEAAGYAMKISIEDNIPPRQINVAKLQELMRKNGINI